MKTIAQPIQVEQEIKRSRFISFLEPVSSAEAARNFIESVRKLYPDARHHCTAFVIRVDGSSPITRSNDDGEPAGTAGMPMLNVLLGADLVDVCAVVVRYFGGIKLGTGGLVRAYGSSVTQAIEAAELVTLKTVTTGSFQVDLGICGQVEAALRGSGVSISEVSYGRRQAKFVLAYEAEQEAELAQQVAALSRGQGQLIREGNHIEAGG